MLKKFTTALSYLDPTDRESWVLYGMAVKAGLGEQGFDAWNEWSKGAASYKKTDAKAVWKSIKSIGGVTEATLFKAAIDAGWEPTTEQQAEIKIDHKKRKRELAEVEREEAQNQQRAAKKARGILSHCSHELHPYLISKGFKETYGNVYIEDDKRFLIIPMYIGKQLVGIQKIDESGDKRFLYGQRTKDACFTIGNGNKVFFVEGYASALSLQKILKTIKVRNTIVVCFSANNLKRIALGRPGFVIADNDESGTGERVAVENGRQWWMPPDIGDDINDYHRRVGTLRASQNLKRILFARNK